MSTSRFFFRPALINGVRGSTSGGRAAHPLNSAYVHNTSGAAFGMVAKSVVNAPIDEVYVMTDLTTGTRGNINLRATVRNTGPSTTRAGSTVFATSTSFSYPAGDDQWVRFVFGTPYTPALNETYWIVIENISAAPTVDFPSIVNGTNSSISMGNPFCVTTVNGYSANGSNATKAPVVIKQGSYVFGQPFSIYAGSDTTRIPSSTRKRGFLVSDIAKFVKLNCFTFSDGFTGFQIFANGVGPNGTPLLDISGINLGSVYIHALEPFVQLTGTGPYRVVQVPTSNNTTYTHVRIEDYASYPSIFNAVYDLWETCPGTYEDGLGGWIDDYAVNPAMSLGFEPPEAPAGGGLFLPRGFDGGYVG